MKSCRSKATKKVFKRLDNPPDLGTIKGKLSRAEIYQDNC
jgi:hypothetical protein